MENKLAHKLSQLKIQAESLKKERTIRKYIFLLTDKFFVFDYNNKEGAVFYKNQKYPIKEVGMRKIYNSQLPYKFEYILIINVENKIKIFRTYKAAKKFYEKLTRK